MIVVGNNDKVKPLNTDNKTQLESFQINGLFGRYVVTMEFNRGVNVFIGENGLGKTTILRCLYYVLKGKPNSLYEIPFDNIKVTFKDGKEIILRKSSLQKYISKNDILITKNDSLNLLVKRAVKDWMRLHGIDRVESIIDGSFLLQDVVDDISHFFNVPNYAVRNYLLNLYHNRLQPKTMANNEDKGQVTSFFKYVNENINEEVIYLPTYRRIESAAFSLPNSENISISNLMHFGMKDIKDNIDEVLNIIRFHSMQGYNHMTGILLSEYTKYETTDKNLRRKSIDPKIASIVLDRLGDEIDFESKEIILRLLDNKEIYNERYLYLQNLLQKLIASYKSLEQYDKQLFSFVYTCNHYFNDKELRYDPSKLTVTLCLKTDDEKKIELSQLSSGEKQVVSLFSMLYLSSLTIPKQKNKKKILLIDEPELSLSMHWQRKLLPDIMNSGNCNMLVAVTHSPFIFDNEYDMFTRELRRLPIDK